jgi:hypothetical protein
MERAVFEQELVAQLAALVEALRAADIDRDRALAAFDSAAWSAWEAPGAPPAPEATLVGAACRIGCAVSSRLLRL